MDSERIMGLTEWVPGAAATGFSSSIHKFMVGRSEHSAKCRGPGDQDISSNLDYLQSPQESA